MSAAALAALLLAAGAPQSGSARVAPLQVPGGLRVREAALADLDGDGAQELVVCVSAEEPFARALLVGSRASAETPFALRERLDLTEDVVAWACADLHADGGEELLLLSASGAFAWLPGAPEERRFVRLAACDLLWQLADPEEAFHWPSAVVDLDRDGLPDLLLPEPGGYRVALQRRDGDGAARFEPGGAPRVPPEGAALDPWTRAGGPRSGRGRRSVTLSLGGGGDEAPRTLLAVEERLPAPRPVDFDGDGRLDLLAQTEERLHVWLQGEDGAFASAPAHSLALPVEADRDRRLDASYSAQALDLDGDGRADCAILAGDRRSDDVRTQVQVFLQGSGRGAGAKSADQPLFGPRGVPQDLLVVAGFVGEPELADLDADGLPELVLRTVRPDLIDQVRSVSTETLAAELLVYRNLGGRFSRRPDLAWRTAVPLRPFQIVARFALDADGDGVRDLVLRDAPERLRVLPLRRRRDGLALVERPLLELALHERARVRWQAGHLLVLEPSQVLVVGFR